MYGNQSEYTEKVATTERTGAMFSDDDMVFDRWIEIAAVAWEGYQFVGPGAVHIRNIDGESCVTYRAASSCNCHPVGPKTYDPNRQVVLFLTDCRPVILEGWPTPPESLKIFDVEIEELSPT